MPSVSVRLPLALDALKDSACTYLKENFSFAKCKVVPIHSVSGILYADILVPQEQLLGSGNSPFPFILARNFVNSFRYVSLIRVLQHREFLPKYKARAPSLIFRGLKLAFKSIGFVFVLLGRVVVAILKILGTASKLLGTLFRKLR